MSPVRSFLVTGAASGIGATIAAAAAEGGDRVGVLDVAPPSALRRVPSSSRRRSSTRLPCDAAFERFGTPDVVVNNAGIVRFGPLARHGRRGLADVVHVNLTGTFLVAREAARRWIGGAAPASSST